MMPESTDSPSLAEALAAARAVLAEGADGEAERLLRHATGLSSASLFAFPERRLSARQWDHFQGLLQRRVAGEPLAYVIGQQGFWRFDLEVDSATLIPRPDTECLVVAALARIPVDARWRIADLGTGSGAIALSLGVERPGCTVLAVDRSLPALRVARRNRDRYVPGNILLLQSDWLAACRGAVFDLIVSNPPYVAEQDPHLDRDGLDFEPRSALVAGADGLDDIRRIIPAAARALKPAGWLLLEHGWDQAAAVRQLLHQQGFDGVSTERDLAGRDRVSGGRVGERTAGQADRV